MSLYPNQHEADLDCLRDVYMTPKQRQAYERLCARAKQAPAQTPAAHWAANGEPDPHGTTYDCERAALALGNLTDDELANAVFLHGDGQPSTADLLSGKALLPSVYLAAAKERIRWLSRQLQAAHPSRGAVDDFHPSHSWPGVDAVLLQAFVAGEQGLEFDMIRARKEIHIAQAAALPAVPDVLNAAERQAVVGLVANAEYEAGDVHDAPPSPDKDEDAYWAYHTYHALQKLLAAAPAQGESA